MSSVKKWPVSSDRYPVTSGQYPRKSFGLGFISFADIKTGCKR